MVFSLENILSNLQIISAMSIDDSLQILAWAYQEAKGMGRETDLDTLTTALSKSSAGGQRLGDLEKKSAVTQLEQNLSPMGRMALHSASWDLQHAEKGSSLWRDAGMIAPGFFRIIELELNEKLLLPVMHKFDFDEFEQYLGQLKATSDAKTNAKIVDFWNGMMVHLRKAKYERKGFELGAIEMLLRKVAKIDGPDSALKAILHNALSTKLSATGVEALRTGQLANLVDRAERERCRNPAAHSRYVDLSTAQRCKQYVEGALKLLITYAEDTTISASTIH